MIPTKPTSKTTLVLTGGFQAIGFFTARDAIRNIMVGGVRGVDSDGNIYDWDQWNSRQDFDEDTPTLRSSAGEFPIPTIVTIPGYFGSFKKFRKNKTRTSSLRQIFNLYGGICQYCEKPIKFSVATKDHRIPKSKGGPNHDDNILLSCKKCNNKKAAKFPFLNARGVDPKPKKVDDVSFLVLANKISVRPEWEPYIQAS